MKKIFILLTLCLLVSTPLLLAGSHINTTKPIVNKTFSAIQPTISRQEARWVYTLKTKYWVDGRRIVLFHLPFDHTTHQSFVRDVLEMSQSAFIKTVEANMNSGFSSLIREVRTEDDMLKQVSNRPGAIGYISRDFLIVNDGGQVDVIKITD